jgi:hypothetical protein
MAASIFFIVGRLARLAWKFASGLVFAMVF